MNYNITKENLKKLYLNDNKKYNIFYLILFTLIFIFLNLEVIKYNFITMLLIYIIYLIILYFVFYIINHIYVNVKLNLNKLYGNYKLEFNDKSISLIDKKINLKDIKKVKMTKNKIYIYTSHDDLIINKEFMSANDYNLIKEKLDDKIYFN